MFKNRALNIQVVKKTPSQENDATKTATLPTVSPDEIAKIFADTAGTAAVLVATLYAGKKLLDTSSEIALIAARARFR